MKKIITIIALLLPVYSFSQTKKNKELSPELKDWYSEKLVMEDGSLLFFRNTPMFLLKNYQKLFTSHSSPQVIVPRSANPRAYSCRWVLKNRQVYLEKYDVNSLDTIVHKTDKGYVAEAVKQIPKEILNKEVEAFTKEKFNKEGCLKASWLNGDLRMYNVQQLFPNTEGGRSEADKTRHQDSLLNHQKYYLATFKKGKLIKIRETDKNWKVIKNITQ